MRIVFMGTPDFAVPSLKALYNKSYDICAVEFNQIDLRVEGKNGYPPVKKLLWI